MERANMQTTVRRLAILAMFFGIALGQAVRVSAPPVEAQGTCSQETGFCINSPAILDYFRSRGGESTFGLPISREFTFLGFHVQFFQGQILQVQPDGSVRPMNLLDEGLMPVTRVNGSTFPAADPNLVSA